MTNKKITIENGLYFTAFLLALLLRISQIGAAPLSEPEAFNAFQALELVKGDAVAVGDNFVYILFTSLLFITGSSSAFLARIVPVLVGSSIALAPMLYKRKIGRNASLLLAFGLAIDPGLIAISRQGSGAVLSIVFLLLTLGFIISKKEIAAGIFSVLAIMSGSVFWYGILILGVYYLLSYVKKKIWPDDNRDASQNEDGQDSAAFHWNKFVITSVICFALVSTGFMLFPAGLNSVLSGLTEFLSGFVNVAGPNITHWFLLFISFEVLTLSLGLLSVIVFIFFRKKHSIQWGFLAGAALLLFLIYPGRNISHLGWLNISLWGMGVSAIGKPPRFEKDEWVPLIGLGILSLITLSFGWINLSGLINLQMPAGNEFQVRVVSMIGAVTIMLLALVLVAWGWSIRVGLVSILYSVFLLLFILTSARVFQVVGAGSPLTHRVWDAPGFADQDLFLSTIQDYSTWDTGFASSIDIVVYQLYDYKLKWALRNFEHVSYVDGLPAEIKSGILVTPADAEVAISEKYTGQDFIYTKSPRLAVMDVYQMARWLLKGQAPEDISNVVLWVRSDLFPGISENAAP